VKGRDPCVKEINRKKNFWRRNSIQKIKIKFRATKVLENVWGTEERPSALF